MTSWLIVAAALTAAAVLASAILQTTVTSLADEVSQSAGLGASAQLAGDPGASSRPTAPGNLAASGLPGNPVDDGSLGSFPTLESEGLTLTSRKRVINGEEFLILEVSDEDGNVEELPPPIQLRSDDSDSDDSSVNVVNAQAGSRPTDALDDYTIDDYVEDQAAQGNELDPISITAAEAELDVIKNTFADSDPEIRDRVLDDVRNRGTAGVAHMAGASSDAMPQDHYQDNLLGLIADTLFGWMRNRGRTPPPSLPVDRGTERPSDSDYDPTPNDTDGDGVPNTIDNDYNPQPGDQDGDGVPDLVDPDTAPADPFDLTPVNPEPVAPAPVAPRPAPSQRDSDYDKPDPGRGTTTNPGNPNNPAGEPDECHGSCA